MMMLLFRLILAPWHVDGNSGLQQAVPAAGCTPVILQGGAVEVSE
jgi:hypothetical protein